MEQSTKGMMGHPAACKIENNERLPENAFVGGLDESMIMGWKIKLTRLRDALFHSVDFPERPVQVIH